MENKELVKLRVSVARIAQAAKVPLVEYVGLPQDATYGEMFIAAEKNKRGWNLLTLAIVEAIAPTKAEQQPTTARIFAFDVSPGRTVYMNTAEVEQMKVLISNV